MNGLVFQLSRASRMLTGKARLVTRLTQDGAYSDIAAF